MSDELFPSPEQDPEPVKVPRLSPTIAKIMVERSPLHAWQAHSMFGGGNGKESTDAQNVGKILEALVFSQPIEGPDSEFVILPFDNYKKKEAQEARDDALAHDKTPILARELEVHIAAGVIIKRRLADQGVVFEGGEYQKLVEWTCQTTGANCKGFSDYYRGGIIWDLKCVADASPRKVQRSFVDYGWDIQSAAYKDGIETNYPDLAGRVRAIYTFAETSPPYVVHLYEPDGMMRELGENKWDRAKRQWVECLETGVWPGYFSGVGQITPTPWQMNALDETMEVVK